nr:MAG TPA: hypothetical protein [Caudoviricetes sp.]
MPASFSSSICFLSSVASIKTPLVCSESRFVKSLPDSSIEDSRAFATVRMAVMTNGQSDSSYWREISVTLLPTSVSASAIISLAASAFFIRTAIAARYAKGVLPLFIIFLILPFDCLTAVAAVCNLMTIWMGYVFAAGRADNPAIHLGVFFIRLHRDLLLESIHSHPTGCDDRLDAVIMFPVLRVQNLDGPLKRHVHLFVLLKIAWIDASLNQRGTNTGINGIIIEYLIAVVIQSLNTSINNARSELVIGDIENLTQPEWNFLLDIFQQCRSCLGVFLIERSAVEQINDAFAVPFIKPVPNFLPVCSCRKIHERLFHLFCIRIHRNIAKLFPQLFELCITLSQSFHHQCLRNKLTMASPSNAPARAQNPMLR